MPTIKVLELVGVSGRNWENAVENALAEAGKSIRNIRGVDVLNTTAKVEDNKIKEYHVNVKLSFVIDES